MGFSVKRMLVAFAVWSGAFALLHSEWAAVNAAAVVVATCLAGATLLGRRNHVVPIVAILCGAAAGIGVCWLIPDVNSRGPGSAEFFHLEKGCLGALVGSLFVRFLFTIDPMHHPREKSMEAHSAEE